MDSDEVPRVSVKRSTRAAIAVAAVVGVIVGVTLGIWGDKVVQRWSSQEPLDFDIAVTMPDASFELVVPITENLVETLGERPALNVDCERLWNVAMVLGAIPRGSVRYTIIAHGNAPGGAVITEMRAVRTRTLPPADGALFTCPKQAMDVAELNFALAPEGVEPLQTDRAEYVYGGTGGWQPRFEDGWVITVSHDQNVVLDVHFGSDAPYEENIDGFAWHIEAEAIVDGEPRTIVIDNNGDDFVQAGWRTEYEQAFGGGGQIGGDWQTVVTSTELRELPLPEQQR
ncbi:MAG: hypothetical protein ACSLE6_14325 [Mycobacterium sp.]